MGGGVASFIAGLARFGVASCLAARASCHVARGEAVLGVLTSAIKETPLPLISRC